MLINNHTITLVINNTIADVFSEDLGIRLNKIMNDPTKLIPSLGEYSFTFTLPITNTNAKIFSYANVPSRKNKFNNIYNAVLYADGNVIFNGNLKLTQTTSTEFSCNLYTNKTNQLQTIFDETKLNEFDWYVDFNGISTINEVNADMTSEYYFPLVAYYPFNKKPKTKTLSGYNIYTPKNTIDDTNVWQYNDFIPSMNMSALLKHLFKAKGFELEGDITTDKVLTSIYLSNNIAQEQDPQYNYGNDNIGRCKFNVKYTNVNDDRGNSKVYYPIYNIQNNDNIGYDSVIPYPLLKRGEITEMYNKQKLMTKNGITIQTDGWYEIITEVTLEIPQSQQSQSNIYNEDLTNTYTISPNPTDMPLEFQLLQYNPNLEQEQNISHNPIYYGIYPNEKQQDERTRFNQQTYDDTYVTNNPQNITYNTATTLVDKYNNPNFICGMAFTQYSNGLAYTKNGNSWENPLTTTNALYQSKNNYYKHNNNNYTLITDYDNTLIGSTEQIPQRTNNKLKGKTHIIIQLQKNTILIPYVNTKMYYQKISDLTDTARQWTYQFNANVTVDVKPVAKVETHMTKLYANMNSLFDKKLNLANFCNKDIYTKDFINNILTAFNLNIKTNKNVVTINKNINNKQQQQNNFINLDNRINNNELTFKQINYPTRIGVTFKTNEQERGIYITAEQNATDEQLQSNTWIDYADRGFKLIDLIYNDSNSENIINTNFAYTIKQNFKYQNKTLDIPIIDYDKHWINDNEYDNGDGRTLSQRFFFRNEQTNDVLTTITNEEYRITIPSNDKIINGNAFHLNYYPNENNLLSNFFTLNTNANADECVVKTYLTPMEYQQITNNANVKLNDELFTVNKIDGYDPSGINPTTLTLMNKL